MRPNLKVTLIVLFCVAYFLLSLSRFQNELSVRAESKGPQPQPSASRESLERKQNQEESPGLNSMTPHRRSPPETSGLNPERKEEKKPRPPSEWERQQLPRHGIPHILWFTGRRNILESKSPKHVYDNIINTIRSYETAIKNTTTSNGNVTVRFLLDSDCRELIAQSEPRLVPHFDAERNGEYKADICRIAALYLHGGYYFDVDMRLLEPIFFPDDDDETRFATALGPARNNFFQSFLASAKHHPILRRALAIMLDYYTDGPRRFREKLEQQPNGTKFVLMGPTTLYLAYERVSDEDKRGAVLFLESNLEKDMFPDLPRQRGSGPSCNFVVHDGAKVYFFSRIPGYSSHC